MCFFACVGGVYPCVYVCVYAYDCVVCVCVCVCVCERSRIRNEILQYIAIFRILVEFFLFKLENECLP